MKRASRNLMLVLAAALALSACGKKGALESPKAAPEEVVKSPDGKPKTGGGPFILDPLVR